MSSALTLHELTASPNNLKVRIALGYKGLEYRRKPVDLKEFPGDRASVVRLSRQPRLPVLEHGTTVIFGSDAILRYLEANFPETPPLFIDDYEKFGEIEQWELFARTQLGEPIGMFFGQLFAPEADATVLRKANELLHERTGGIEDKLSTGEFLVGDHLTAGDIACAAFLQLADQTDDHARSHPLLGFFHQHMHLGEQRDRTRAWSRRVVSYDPVVGRR